MSQQTQRRPKQSYSCAPCKRLKIKCDHNVPCSSCLKNSREDECLNAPAKSLSQFKELIRPNESFGRIAKPHSPTRQSKQQQQSKHNSFSSVSSIEPFSSPEEQPSSSSSVDRENSMLMDALLKDQSAKMDELIQRNNYLSIQNNELMRQVGFYFHLSSRPGIQDYAVPVLTSERLVSMKKMMCGLLPARNVSAVLKKHFFVCVSYLLDDIVDSTEFERDYEKMWSQITNDRVASVDLIFLSLVFVVLAVGLRTAPRELMLSNEGLVRFWASPQAVEQASTEWFRASRQILGFFKQPGLLRCQVFAVQQVFCSLTNDMETLDELIPTALFDARKLMLDQPKKNTDELGRKLWWSLCSIDTQRALDTGRCPLVMCCYSRVPMPEKSPYLQKRAQMLKILSGLYTYDFETMTPGQKLQTVVSIDQQLCQFAAQFQPTRGKVDQFQRTSITIELAIHRHRLYESFIHDQDVPLASSVCTFLSLSLFSTYNTLKQKYIISQDPLYLVLAPQLVQAAIVNAVFLLHNTRLNLEHVDSIKRDLFTLQQDLVAMECFAPLTVVMFGMDAMKFLDGVTLQQRRRSSGDSVKMRLNSIMNSGQEEVVSLTTVPLGMLEESVRVLAALDKSPLIGEEDAMEQAIQRQYGSHYNDYTAFQR